MARAAGSARNRTAWPSNHWRLAAHGIARWTTGFPVNILNGFRFPTNWEFEGLATQIAPAVTGTTKNPDGTVNLFPDPLGPTGIQAFTLPCQETVAPATPFAATASPAWIVGLAKRWKMPWRESHTLQFRWDVYNVLNLTRFDVQSISAPSIPVRSATTAAC